jgi:hypothetical protein
MSIGFIFECGPQGADKQVCEYLAGEMLPGVTCQSITLDNKPNLLANAPMAARTLLAEGCERVLIIWDLRPAWPDKAAKACRAAERQTLLDALTNEGLQGAPVYLVCVEQEFESWLMADEAKLSAFLSTPTHEYKVPKVRRPDREKNPKSLVMKHFQMARGMKYEDRVHAIKVMRTNPPPNWARLRRSESFARFEAKLAAV